MKTGSCLMNLTDTLSCLCASWRSLLYHCFHFLFSFLSKFFCCLCYQYLNLNPALFYKTLFIFEMCVVFAVSLFLRGFYVSPIINKSVFHLFRSISSQVIITFFNTCMYLHSRHEILRRCICCLLASYV